jgi:hypothetical protein
MPDLETRLRALGAESTFPPTPPLAEAVTARLLAAPAPRARGARRRALALALAAALLIPAAAVAAIPDARDAVLEWLGLRDSGVEIRRVPTTPAAPAPAPDRLALGDRVTLAEARARVRFTPRLPATLGRPARVHVAGTPRGGRISLVYAPRPGLPQLAPGVGALVVEFRGSGTRQLIQKALGPGTRVRRVAVDGAPGAFLSGDPHAFVFVDADGAVQEETLRLAGNVLVWERAGLVLRLEADVGLREALRIARSVE